MSFFVLGRLSRTVLAEYEPPPAAIHIVHPEGRHLPGKIRLFLDHAAGELHRKFGPQVEIRVGPPFSYKWRAAISVSFCPQAIRAAASQNTDYGRGIALPQKGKGGPLN